MNPYPVMPAPPEVLPTPDVLIEWHHKAWEMNARAHISLDRRLRVIRNQVRMDRNRR